MSPCLVVDDDRTLDLHMGRRPRRRRHDRAALRQPHRRPGTGSRGALRRRRARATSPADRDLDRRRAASPTDRASAGAREWRADGRLGVDRRRGTPGDRSQHAHCLPGRSHSTWSADLVRRTSPSRPAEVSSCAVPRAAPVWSPDAVRPPDHCPDRGETSGGVLPALLALAGSGLVAVVLHQPMFLIFGALGAIVAFGTWGGQRFTVFHRRRRDARARDEEVAEFERADQCTARRIHRPSSGSRFDARFRKAGNRGADRRSVGPSRITPRRLRRVGRAGERGVGSGGGQRADGTGLPRQLRRDGVAGRPPSDCRDRRDVPSGHPRHLAACPRQRPLDRAAACCQLRARRRASGGGHSRASALAVAGSAASRHHRCRSPRGGRRVRSLGTRRRVRRGATSSPRGHH